MISIKNIYIKIFKIILFFKINIDGTCTAAVVGDAILLYDSDSGMMLTNPMRNGNQINIFSLKFNYLQKIA